MKNCDISDDKMIEIYKNIGANVKRIRNEKNISQLALSLAIGHKAAKNGANRTPISSSQVSLGNSYITFYLFFICCYCCMHSHAQHGNEDKKIHN